MPSIKFSHLSYSKLHHQERAILVHVEVRDRAELSDKFIDYDCSYYSGKEIKKYPLPDKGLFLVLVFLGNDFIPFTTVRPFAGPKAEYYRDNIGKLFYIHKFEHKAKPPKQKEEKPLPVGAIHTEDTPF